VNKNQNIVIMDDNRFDSMLRSKLEDYHHPVIDHTAIAALHQQQAVGTEASWYTRYRTEVLIGSGIVLVLLLYFLGYTLLNHTISLTEHQTKTISEQNAEIAALKKEVSRLQALRPDTIRIITSQQQDLSINPELLKRISFLEESNKELMALIANSRTIQSRSVGEESIPLTSMSEFSVSPKPIDMSNNINQPALATQTLSSTHEKYLSTKSIRALEKHYSHGVGIKIGPTADVFLSRYSLGNGELNVSGGILTDFIVSPALGLETGIKYSERFFAIDDQNALSGSTLPGVDEQLGNLKSAEVDYRLLEIPINLKYRHPLSLNDHWIASIGYSCLVYLNEDFEYTYEFDNPSTNPTSIVSTVTTNEAKVYPGTINFSLGMSHLLKNKKIIEASLFYNHGIGTQGLEKTRAQYFGLRGTYWFTVK